MTRISLVVLAIALGTPSPTGVQAPYRPAGADWDGIRFPVLAEHATGGEVPVVIGGLSVAGVVSYDILTAPASARLHNERNPDDPRKSPRTALLLSLASTAVPVVVGGVMADRSAGGSGEEIVLAGLVVGPSMGHWYAERPWRVLGTAALRTALAAFTAYMYECCT